MSAVEGGRAVFLYLVEHDRGQIDEITLGGLTGARRLAEAMGAALHAAVIGERADGPAEEAGRGGAEEIHLVRHPLLTDYGPDAWAECLVQLAEASGAAAVLAAGTDRGNEVMAHAGARLDLPMTANCLEIEAEEGTGGGGWLMTDRKSVV